MPKYHFDVQDGKGLHRDDIGDEIDSIEEARDQTQSVLPDIARDERPGGDLHVVACDVGDEAGRVVYRGEITYRRTRP